VDRLNVRTAIQKHLYNIARRPCDRAVQRRTSSAVSTIQQRGICIEKFANTPQVSGPSSDVYGVILTSRGRSSPATACPFFFEHRDDVIVATLFCHVDQTESVVSIPFRISAGGQQHLYGFRVSFTNCKVNGRSVEVAFLAEAGITVEKPSHGHDVARIRGSDDFPNLILDVRRLDHHAISLVSAIL
jgi:hypothetical protein